MMSRAPSTAPAIIPPIAPGLKDGPAGPGTCGVITAERGKRIVAKLMAILCHTLLTVQIPTSQLGLYSNLGTVHYKVVP